MADCQSSKLKLKVKTVYTESDSDDSEDDECMDDTVVTASGNDSPLSLEGDLEAVMLVHLFNDNQHSIIAIESRK